MSRSTRAIIGGILVTALLLLYVWVLGVLSIDLIRSDSWVGRVLGVCLIVTPLFALWATIREWWMGISVDRMAKTLADEGGLPVDNLPRSPGGRIDRTAADAEFDQYQRAVEVAPTSWRDWFRLALAYDACGDRKRARAAFRTAAKLRRHETIPAEAIRREV